jgi:hypothetical protein
MAAAWASRPPWGRHIQSLVSASGSVGGLDSPFAAEVEVRKVLVLVVRCRGAMGVGGLELARRTMVISVTVGRKGCSQSGFRYMSPWQRSEAVEEASRPCRVARTSGFHWRCDESFLMSPCRSREIDDHGCAAWG